jgi:L-asparaginase II
VARLPEPARRLVEVVALSGSGLPVGVAFHAAGPDRALVALASLRSGNLVRSTGAAGLHLVAWHDRVREGVVAGLDDATARGLHADLAAAWEAHGSAEPEVLLGHHRAAGAGT